MSTRRLQPELTMNDACGRGLHARATSNVQRNYERRVPRLHDNIIGHTVHARAIREQPTAS